MSEPSRRALTALVVRADGAAVVVDEHGHLPLLTVELEHGETTTSGARRLLGPWLGADLPVLELLFDEAATGGSTEPLATLVDLVAPPDGWTPIPPRRWQPVNGSPPGTPAAFAGRVARLLDERRGRLPVHPLRSSWSRPGWYEEITRWMDDALVADGRPPTSGVSQIRHWGISAVLRATSGTDIVWCKAVFPPFRREAGVTAFLDRVATGCVAPVIAAEVERGWLLMQDVGEATFEERFDAPEPAIAAMTALHHRFTGRVDELLAAGFPDRRLAHLPNAVAEALADPELASIHGLDARRVDDVLSWLRLSVPVLEGLGMPDTLVHGDFHPGNVVSDGDRIVVFDWSDAAVASPLVDVVTWQWWCTEETCRDRVWAAFIAGWQGLADTAALTAHRSLCEGVAAAHHVVSYAGILRAIEPGRRHETANGLTDFAARLSRALPLGWAPRPRDTC